MKTIHISNIPFNLSKTSSGAMLTSYYDAFTDPDIIEANTGTLDKNEVSYIKYIAVNEMNYLVAKKAFEAWYEGEITSDGLKSILLTKITNPKQYQDAYNNWVESNFEALGGDNVRIVS